MRSAAILAEAFSARIEATEALLRAANPRAKNAEELRLAASRLDDAACLYGRASVAVAYSALAELIRITAMMVDWRSAVLDAGSDAERFLRSAKERYRLWTAEYGSSKAAAGLATASSGIAAASTVEDAGAICASLAGTPLPIGVFAEEREPAGRVERSAEHGRAPARELAVAFLQFLIDGAPASETHFLTPGEAHDLEIEVRVSRWPESAESLQLEPITIEPPASYEFPIFRFERPAGAPPFLLKQRGRAILKIPHSVQARPFEFKYAAEFLPRLAEQPVAVVGQRTLRIEGFDINLAGLSGYPNIDRKLLWIRDRLHYLPLVTAEELGNVLTVLTPLANLAGRALQDALFRGIWSEARFQENVRAELRRRPEIASELEEHPRAAGGITDLSFRGIRIELKSEPKANLSFKDCERFADQTLSYIVATGKRVGILCVLDCSPKQKPPFPADEGIGILFRPTQTAQVAIATVLVQGNLPRPSDFSR